MKIAFIDLETFSTVDLRKHGVYDYANSNDFNIVIGCFDLDGKTLTTEGTEQTVRVVKKLISRGYKLIAHNAAFEYACLKDATKPQDWICTMVLSAYYSGVSSLKNASVYWGLSEHKLLTGSRLIKWVLEVYPNIDKQHKNYIELIEYCKMDVEVTKKLYNIILKEYGDIPNREKLYFYDTLTLLNRYIPVDLELKKKIVEIRELYSKKVNEKFKTLYGFNPRSHAQTKAWASKKGCKLTKFNKKEIKLNYDTLSDNVKKMFKLKQAVPSTMLKKVDYIISDKLRINVKHFGTITGRYSGSGVNILNLPRGSYDKDILGLSSKEYIIKNGLNTANKLQQNIRGLFKSDIYITACDYSQIEFRLLMFFCGHLNVLKDINEGKDLYVEFAKSLWGEITPERRTIAKMCILGLGYGMGYKALHNLVVQHVPSFSLLDSKKSYHHYHKTFHKVRLFHNSIKRKLESGDRYIVLRNKRKLYIRDFDQNLPVDRIRREFNGTVVEKNNYSSAICGLYVQSSARELLFEKQHLIMRQGHKVLFNVYDEIVCVVKNLSEVDKITEIMSKTPKWLEGLTLNVVASTDKRYIK